MGWKAAPDRGPTGSSGIISAATYALERFEARRIPVPDNSRLERARAFVEAAHQDLRSVPADLLAEAIRTIHEMQWVARALGRSNRRPAKRLTNTIAAMLAGPDMASEEDDEKSSKPRNLQFELFVAGILAAGGLRVEYAEPDLRMHYLGYWVGIAAKRARRRRKLLRRVNEAAGQIEARVPAGMVAINVDGLLDEIGGEGTPWNEVAARLDQLPELVNAIEALRQRPRIIGLLALGTHVWWRDRSERPSLEMATYLKWNLLGHSESEERESKEFLERFEGVFATRSGF